MKSSSIITEIIKWAICIAIGGVVGFLILLILGDTLTIFISSILVGFIVGFVSAAIISQTSLKGIYLFVSIFLGLVAFVAYLIFLNHVNNSNETSIIGGFVAFFWPLPVVTYALISGYSENKS